MWHEVKEREKKDNNIMLQMTQLCLEIIEMQDFFNRKPSIWDDSP